MDRLINITGNNRFVTIFENPLMKSQIPIHLNSFQLIKVLPENQKNHKEDAQEFPGVFDIKRIK